MSNIDKFELTGIALYKYLKEQGSPEMIKMAIEQREEYGLTIYHMRRLLPLTNDATYIKSAIEKKDEFGFNPIQIKGLVIATEDADYIKSIITRKEEFGFSPYSLSELVQATHDLDFIKQVVEARAEYGFDANDLMAIIRSANDIDYTLSIIERKEEFGLDYTQLEDMIKNEQILKVILEKGGLGFDLRKIIMLMAEVQDFESVQAYFDTHAEKQAMLRHIMLPPDMTIGVEIESEGIMTKKNKPLVNALVGKWSCKDDGSLESGVEIVSPILTQSEQSEREIYSVCDLLNFMGQTVSERCGGHIHIGADYLTSVQSYRNLLELWSNTEEILYTICNAQGIIPRDGMDSYAVPISKKVEEALTQGEIDFRDEESIEQFAEEINTIQGDRFSGINFKNLGTDEKNTIEFRLSNGTTNPDTWIENINLFGGIIRTAEELSQIQAKSEEERSFEEQVKIQLFEHLSGDIGEDDKLDILLQLVIAESERHIYTDRYATNRQLIQKQPELLSQIHNGIAKSKIAITKKQLGKKALAGNNPIRGEEYSQVSEAIHQELTQQRENEPRGEEI